MVNEVILIGKLVKKPMLEESKQGTRSATMVLEVSRDYRNITKTKVTDQISCTLWRGLAHYVNDHCDIGSLLTVKGRLLSNTVELTDVSILFE